MICFDIESGPLPDAELLEMLPPFIAPPHPGEFDPATVKCGNLKDAAKIKDKIDAARADHELACRSHGTAVLAAKESHFSDFKRDAALSPLTGRVLAIGLCRVDPRPNTTTQPEIIGLEPSETEHDILQSFWDGFICGDDTEPYAGWNIFGFDLPFLVKRSWKLGVVIPPAIREANDRYWSTRLVDLMKRFQVGNPSERFTKLDDAARFFGVGDKGRGVEDGGCDGATFARLWLSTLEAERERAIAYLLNDMQITAGVARRMGLAN